MKAEEKASAHVASTGPLHRDVGAAGRPAPREATRAVVPPIWPTGYRVAVVIPCYRVRAHILDVLTRIGKQVQGIYAVDDACPDQSGDFIEQHCTDPRVRVLRHAVNRGVGGAVMTGYRAALADGFDCIVKIDGDGQMDPALLPLFVAPIAAGRADYSKGNRFFHPEDTLGMPWARLVGNMGLSFLSKLSSGYWSVFDPTNGYTAIDARVVAQLRLDKIATRYFFESDLLFRLNLIDAVVVDVPMRAVYADEVSNLKVRSVLPRFALGHLKNIGKRIYYNYYLRGFSVASVELVLGLALTLFGAVFGALHWFAAESGAAPATAGTVMVAALPIIVGVQLLLSFINFDVHLEPRHPIGPMLGDAAPALGIEPAEQAASAPAPAPTPAPDAANRLP